MKIAHRLYLTVLPAVLGVLTVAGLAYWGQYANAIPSLLLIIAAVASIGSLVLSWINARYVAQRIARLAGASNASRSTLRGVASALLPRRLETQPDELDRIEGVVDHLSNAVAGAEAEKTEHERLADARVRDYATMVEHAAAAAATRLEEVRLPLHILLENRFGDLNDNQEEMLGAARAAAEAADSDVVSLRQLAELGLGKRALRRDRLLPADVLRALVPTLQAIAEQAGVMLRVDIEPLVPAIYGDQPQIQDALATLLGDAIRASGSGGELELTLVREPEGVRIALHGAGSPEEAVRRVLADRIIEASGGSVTRDASSVEIRFGKNEADPSLRS